MNKKRKEKIKEKEKELFSRSTKCLYDYRTWECKSISTNITSKLYDQIKYTCKSIGVNMADILKLAIVDYLKNNYPREWDNARMYVKKIEMEKLEKSEENNLVERDDRND